jgi:hypothetical protein
MADAAGFNERDYDERVRDLVGQAAGNYYEGWPTYWRDSLLVEEVILAILKLWYVKAKEESLPH